MGEQLRNLVRSPSNAYRRANRFFQRMAKVEIVQHDPLLRSRDRGAGVERRVPSQALVCKANPDDIGPVDQ
jgi:hypothetical protein